MSPTDYTYKDPWAFDELEALAKELKCFAEQARVRGREEARAWHENSAFICDRAAGIIWDARSRLARLNAEHDALKRRYESVRRSLGARIAEAEGIAAEDVKFTWEQ